MTRLILSPSVLFSDYSMATPAEPTRIRLIVQLVKFSSHNSLLTIQAIPLLSDLTQFDIDISSLLDEKHWSFKKGDFLNIEAYFNGTDIDAFRINRVSDLDNVIKEWRVLEYMSSIKPIK